MHNIDLILTVTGGLAMALLMGFIAQRIGLSPMVGYLIAGIAVGPHTPGYVANRALAEQLAEIGIILLMFGVGLHFHLKELLAVRRVAIPGAVGQSIVATILGAVLAHSFGWDWSAGLVFGLAISVASTVVLLRVLADNRDLHTMTGHIAVGWLVVEDLFTVLVLVLLPELFGPHAAGAAGVMYALGTAIVKIGVLAVFTLVVGGRAIPWVLDRVVESKSRELFTLTILVIALGIAVGSAKFFGVSMPLGAFLAGMVVGRSDFSFRAASEALPMRDAFAVLFFVSVGMLFDPLFLIQSPLLVASTLAVVMLGKPLIAIVIVLWLKYPLRVALSVAVALAQIGEFSFILASLGTELKILPPAATSALVAAAIVSISLNPLLYGMVQRVETWMSNSERIKRWLPAPPVHAAGDGGPAKEAIPSRYRAVVVGYGPVGQIVCRLLRENQIDPTVIELNIETVRRLREQGIAAVYGDASHRDILDAAGVRQAAGFILSSAGTHGNEETIRMAKELNPGIRVLARAAFVRELPALQTAGAEAVFSGEGEVALAFTEEVMRELGATPEQIDRERERVRSDLSGGPGLHLQSTLDSDLLQLGSDQPIETNEPKLDPNGDTPPV
jgi:CPA2 family monovalent cation:H+ antiporter-2